LERVRFYRTAAGASPVEKYLDGLERREAEQVFAAILDIKAHGLEGSTLHLRPIAGKLWELKVSAQRVFYVVVTGPELVLLHAYRKQSRKAPRGEIETAMRRLSEVLD
jgi:phage-related protein